MTYPDAMSVRNVIIKRVWQESHEPDRIHYLIETVANGERDLYIDKSDDRARRSELYEVLKAWLDVESAVAFDPKKALNRLDELDAQETE